MADLDYALALSLQDEFSCVSNETTTTSSAKRKRPTSIVDDCWETIDPTPDIRELFLQFNDTYFEGALLCCEVKWAPRMTLCAGVCCYEGRGGLCSIKLSMPLLKLRPRKDLVQTLLHEMIHAYLFVTHNNKDHDAHGPEFHRHMHRINKQSGANITVYHNFHDEVDIYRQHWWRCDGPCQKRPPYYGMVKRAMNRPPAPRDPWWAEHQKTCGGVYHKVQEPENYGKKKRKKDDTSCEDSSIKGMPKIYDLWKKERNGTNCKGPDDKLPNGKHRISNLWREEENEHKNSSSGKENDSQNSVIIPFTGKGHVLGSASSTNSLSKYKNVDGVVISKDRGSRSVPTNLRSTSKIGSTSLNPVDKSNIRSSLSKGREIEGVLEIRDFQVIEESSAKSTWEYLDNPKRDSSSSHLKRNTTDIDGKSQGINVDIGVDSGRNHLVKQARNQPSAELNSSILNKKEALSKDDKGTQLTIVNAFKNVGDKKAPWIVIDDTPPRSSAVKLVPCPVCQRKVEDDQINAHLDACLT